MDVKNKARKPHGEWVDDIKDWLAYTRELSYFALNRNKMELDNYGEIGLQRALNPLCLMMMVVVNDGA